MLTGLWVAVAVGVLAVREVLLPFAVAGLLAYVLHPAVTWLNQRPLGKARIPRWVATLMMYGLLLGTGWALVAVFVPQIREEVAGFSRNIRASSRDADTVLEDWVAEANAVLARWGAPLTVTWEDAAEPAGPQPDPRTPAQVQAGRAPNGRLNLRAELLRAARNLEEVAASLVGQVAQQAQGVVGALVGFVFKFFLVLMLAAFILSDVQRIRATVLSLVPAARRDTLDRLLDNMDTGLSGVVRGQLTICAVNAALTLVGLLLIQVKFAFLLALLAGLFSLIPIFGSIVSSIPIVAIALTDSFQKALFGLLWIVGIHALEANLLNPKIMGDAAKIHPVLVVMVLVAGEHFYGFTGALFAVPVLSVLLTLFKWVHARAIRLDAEALPPAVPPSTP